MVGWPRRGRSSVVRDASRWRLAVFACTIARRSESLRMRLVWRVAAAFGGCVEASGGPPRRGGDPRVGLFAAGPRLFGFLSAVACVALLGGGAACGRRVLGPSPRRRLTEPARFGGIKPDRCCCGPAPFGLTPPNRAGWLRPLTRRGTQNQHPAWSGRNRRTTRPVALRRRHPPTAPPKSPRPATKAERGLRPGSLSHHYISALLNQPSTIAPAAAAIAYSVGMLIATGPPKISMRPEPPSEALMPCRAFAV